MIQQVNDIIAETVTGFAFTAHPAPQGSLLSVFHDVNNYLQVALGNLAFLEPQALDERAQTRLAYVRQSIEQCSRLARAALSDARQVAGRSDLDAVMPAIVQRLAFACGDGISVELKLAATGLAVPMSAERLEDALLNLAMNAKDAMHNVGRLRIECFVERGTRTEPDTIVLRVSDSGPGISEEIQKRIFERFFTTKSGGSGLGLNNVQEYIREMGGTIDVQSLEGVGTTFALRFFDSCRLVPLPDEHASQGAGYEGSLAGHL